MTFSPTLAVRNHLTDEVTMRMLVDALAGGRRGPLGQLDLRVLPLLTPGAGFRVTTGRFVGPVVGRPYEGYFGGITVEETVTGLQGTGSAGGRHDLVVVRTNDPSIPGPGAVLPGDGSPAAVLNGPYTFIEVIQGVPLYTRSFAELGELYSGFAISRPEYAANQAVIGAGNARIVDLRPGTSDAAAATDPVGTPPAASSQYVMRPLRGTDAEDDRLTASTVAKTWPARTAGWAPITIPPYATRMGAKFDIEGALLYGGTVAGSVWVQVGPTSVTEASTFVFPVGGQPIQKRIPGVADFPIPAALRGKTVQVSLKATLSTNTSGTYLRFGPGGLATLELFFYADPALS